MKIMRKIIEIDEEKCDGCGNCVTGCAEGALAIVDGKAKVTSDNLCDGLGACIGECPQGALQIIEREAEAFDEQAVEKHLESQNHAAQNGKTMACGCPSTQIQTFSPCVMANKAAIQSSAGPSMLSHWPVQIRLVPANAPFLKRADLIVAADCVPVAFPSFHRDLLKDKAVMLGCPKFDDAQAYVDKFTQIFQTAGIKSVTIAIMEVPCCAGLPQIVRKAMQKAGVHIPLQEVVINTRGKIIEERKVA